MGTTTKIEHFGGGMHISDAAKILIDAVRGGAEAAEGEFNGVTLRAVKGTTVAEIETQLTVGMEAASEAYRKSPEGIAAKAKEKAETISRQATCDALMVEFKTLDLANDAALLDWLDRFQDFSDDRRIQKDTRTVINALEGAGYVSGANCGDAFNESNRDNFARYLVGQALSCLLSMGAIHQVFGTIHGKWKAKFLTSPTPTGA